MMTRFLRIGVLVGCLTFASGTGQAQRAGKPLTDADVESMLKAGLPENTIVLAIQLAARRGEVHFDTSAPALIELKKMGASGRILNTMLSAGTGNVVPGLPEQVGVYLETPSGWVALDSFMIWPPLYAVTPGKQHMEIPVGGPHAQLQIAEQKPIFYVRGLRASGWKFIRLDEKGSQRVLRVTYSGMFSSGPEITLEDTRLAEVKAVGDDVFTVAPAVNLQPGEYLLCATLPEARGLLRCEAFGLPATTTAARPMAR